MTETADQSSDAQGSSADKDKDKEDEDEDDAAPRRRSNRRET